MKAPVNAAPTTEQVGPPQINTKMMMRRVKSHFLRATFKLILCAPLSAAAATIAIDDSKLRQAGIEFQKVQITSNSGQVLRLPGIALYSSSGLQLISAPAAGVVREISVQPMQQVKAGTTVIRLHSPQVLEWQREYLQGQSRLTLASEKLRRDQALFDEGIIARSRLEESRSGRQQALAAVEEMRQLLRLAGMSRATLAKLNTADALSAELQISAGSAGSIAEQMVNVGQRVEAGAPLLRLARGGDLLVELQAGRNEAARIAVGDSVRVAGCDKPGRITAKGVQVNPANQAVPVRASVPGSAQCLRPNQHLEAEISLAAGSSDSSVPAAAIVRQQGRDYVFLREPGGARPLPVTVIGTQGDRVLVQGKLPQDASVAVKGTAVLKGIWAGMGQEGS